MSRTVHTLALCAALLGGGVASAQQPERPRRRASAPRLSLLELRDVELREALRVISLQTKLNVIASATAAATPVSLVLRDVDAEAALRGLCETHDLWFQRDEETGIYRISTAAEYRRDIQSFRAAEIEVFTLLYPNAYDVALAVRDLFGDRVRLGDRAQEDPIDELSDRFQRFDMMDSRSQGLGQLGTSGGLGNTGTGVGSTTGLGGGFGGGFSGTGLQGRRGFQNSRRTAFGQSQTQDDDEPPVVGELSVEGLRGAQIQQLEAGADAEQVIASLLRQTSIYVSTNPRTNQLFVRTGDADALRQVRELVQSLDRPTPIVLLEVKVMSIELNDDFSSIFDLQFNHPESRLGGQFTSGTVAQQPAALVDPDDGALRRATDFGVPGTGINPDHLVFQYVGRYLHARMQLLAGEGRITTLATPVLLTANNEVSRLFAGEERPVNRSFDGGQTVVGDGGTVVTPATTGIEFRPVGTSLIITPNINADRTVTLLLLQETSSINENGATVLVPVDTGFQRQPVDVVQSRSVSGTVVAKDGQMIAIGGLIEEQLSDQREGIPILSQIPLLGFFFRRQEVSRIRRELVITITPHVLTTPQEAEAASRRLLRENSIHPKRNDPRGSLESFSPDDVLRAPEPGFEMLQIFDLHGGVDYDD